jgi:hypothetical protein
MAKDSKTIGVTIRFWNMVPGQVQPGHAWAAGTIYVQANEAHGIKSGEALPEHHRSDLLVRTPHE